MKGHNDKVLADLEERHYLVKYRIKRRDADGSAQRHKKFERKEVGS